MGEDDYLTLECLHRQAAGDIPPATMIEGRHRVIEYDAATSFAKLDFSKERIDGDRPGLLQPPLGDSHAAPYLLQSPDRVRLSGRCSCRTRSTTGRADSSWH